MVWPTPVLPAGPRGTESIEIGLLLRVVATRTVRRVGGGFRPRDKCSGAGTTFGAATLVVSGAGEDSPATATTSRGE